MLEEEKDSLAPKRGRPKGAKNKPKRGRPKLTAAKRKEKERAARQLAEGVHLPVIKKLQERETLVVASNLQASITSEKHVTQKAEENSIDRYLDDEKLLDAGYNTHTDKIINQEPIDPSFYYRGSKNVPVAGAQFQFTADMVEELRRCKDDIVYFAENFFYVVTLDRGKEKIKLYEAQKRVLRSFVSESMVIVCTPRQIGKSTLLTIFALWMVCFNEDYRTAIVANKESTARNIFKRIRMAYEQLPNYIKPGVKDYAKTGMTLGNDSSIIVSTTTATSIRGDSLNTVLLDEASHIETHYLEEFWSSVIPTVSSGKNSKILVVSTPNGVGNKFYEIFSAAEKNALPPWKAERIDWWEVPGRDEEWKQRMIAALGSEEKFMQEFNNTFIDNASSAVGALVIERFKQNKKPAIWTSEDGEYNVYEYPDKNKLYVVGVDVGEGIGRAASVAQVLDVTDLQNIKQVAVYGSAVIEPYHFANKLSVIGQSWGLPPMLIERNNCGAQVIDALHYKHQYEKIVCYTKISEQEKYNRTRHMGVLSHNNIRFQGVQNMRYWVNHLQVVHINDPQTISEFETFVKQPNGTYRKRNDNFYDDRIMSLIWALFILEPEISQQYFDIIDFDMQHKPLKISSNGYWENLPEFYALKDLGKFASIIPKPYRPEEEVVSATLGVTQKDLTQVDKYDLDLEQLMEMGYQFLEQPDV